MLSLVAVFVPTTILSGQSVPLVPLDLEGVDGYFATRSYVEAAILGHELGPRWIDRIAGLQVELEAADRQIADRDTLISRMEVEAGILRGIADAQRAIARERGATLKAVERRYRRVRIWRGVAVTSTLVAVVLAVKVN
jgi:hypothetical protein